jgi:hypothetical protein
VDEKIPACLSLLHSAYIESSDSIKLIIPFGLKNAINAFAKGEESFSFLGQKISFQF